MVSGTDGILGGFNIMSRISVATREQIKVRPRTGRDLIVKVRIAYMKNMIKIHPDEELMIIGASLLSCIDRSKFLLGAITSFGI